MIQKVVYAINIFYESCISYNVLLFCSTFSTYQVIVVKVADGVEELPGDYGSKLKNFNDAKKDNLNFYVAAEIGNDPVRDKSWKFTVGDEKTYGTYTNEGLKSGEDYIVYQRAITRENNVSKT